MLSSLSLMIYLQFLRIYATALRCLFGSCGYCGKEQNKCIFFEKVAIFRHFSGRFVIFNIEVNKLEIRKISPILTLF